MGHKDQGYHQPGASHLTVHQHHSLLQEQTLCHVPLMLLRRLPSPRHGSSDHLMMTPKLLLTLTNTQSLDPVALCYFSPSPPHPDRRSAWPTSTDDTVQLAHVCCLRGPHVNLHVNPAQSIKAKLTGHGVDRV